MDERPQIACCQNATAEELETEPDVYDCSTCPVVDAQTQLWIENAEAWSLFQRLASRFVVDVGLTGDLFHALTAGASAADLVDIMERLTLIYDVVLPPKQQTAPSA